MPMIVNEFANSTELNSAFASRIIDILGKAVEQNGKATLAVSGGSTPKPLFETLSKIPFEWDKVFICLVDERCVNSSHNDSNTRLVHQHLLSNEAKRAKFVDITTADDDAINAEHYASDQLDKMADKFDLIILGMGEDGHTASLFPCSEQIAAGLDLSRELSAIATQPTTAPHQRISMSLAKIVNAKHVFLHLVGGKKRAVLEDALLNYTAIEKPIKAVIENTNVDLMWAP